MNFFTVGKNYYVDYILEVFVTNDVETLKNSLVNEFYKIVIIESGTIHIHLNGKKFILTGASALCINEKDNFIVNDMNENTVTIIYFKPFIINNKFNFDTFKNIDMLSITETQDLEYLSRFNYNSKISSKILQLNAIDIGVINQKIERLKEQLNMQNSSYWPCRSRSYLFEILFLLAGSEKENDDFLTIRIDSNFSKRTIEIITYLQACYNQKITIEKLAQEFHTNRTTLLNDFKKSTGQSINQYLTKLRVTMAATLLRDTKLTVNEICERTGFSDISYFSKTFKKEIKSTPSEYRRINGSQG